MTDDRLADDDRIIAVILSHEGSVYTNDPADAGGPTRWGITLANLSSWRGHSCTANDVRTLTRDEAAAIYRAQYIRPFDQLATSSLRVNVIDMGVNAGVRRATMLLQQMVGVTVDAWLGPETVGALAPLDLTIWNTVYVGLRLAYYEDLIRTKPRNVKWRRGWRIRALSFLAPLPTKIPAPAPAVSARMARAALTLV